MIEVKFKYKFNKLYGIINKTKPFRATLLQCLKVRRQDLAMPFIVYDTQYQTERYPIEEDKLLLLIFQDYRKKRIFTTLKKCNDANLRTYATATGSLCLIRLEDKMTPHDKTKTTKGHKRIQ